MCEREKEREKQEAKEPGRVRREEEETRGGRPTEKKEIRLSFAFLSVIHDKS